MLDKVKLPNQIISLDVKNSPFYKDRYSQFYGFHIKNQKERKKWEKMIKEMKEPFQTKLVHSP